VLLLLLLLLLYAATGFSDHAAGAGVHRSWKQRSLCTCMKLRAQQVLDPLWKTLPAVLLLRCRHPAQHSWCNRRRVPLQARSRQCQRHRHMPIVSRWHLRRRRQYGGLQAMRLRLYQQRWGRQPV
jgi:hypothetical protein